GGGGIYNDVSRIVAIQIRAEETPHHAAVRAERRCMVMCSSQIIICVVSLRTCHVYVEYCRGRGHGRHIAGQDEIGGTERCRPWQSVGCQERRCRRVFLIVRYVGV